MNSERFTVNQGNIEKKMGMKITALLPLSTTSHGATYKFSDHFGETFFIKTSFFKKDMLIKEAHGLDTLRQSRVIKIPKVHFVDQDILVTEYIKSRPGNVSGYRLLGKKMAMLHHMKADCFGLDENNYIGIGTQINGSYDLWSEFFFDKRLLVQFQRSLQKRFLPKKFQMDFMILEKAMSELLKNIDEGPALVHGDLWCENILFDQFDRPVLIDPAVYYGHREVDLAMARLFGGIPDEFFQAYEEAYPLQEGYQKRFELYNLYHLLNHLNIFGKSYLSQCENALKNCLE